MANKTKQNKKSKALLVDEMSCHVDLTKSELVMILVVENVHEVRVEGMNLFDFGKFVEHERETIVKALLREFHLTHVERTYACDLVVFVHYGRRFSLGFRQDQVDKLLLVYFLILFLIHKINLDFFFSCLPWPSERSSLF